MSLSEALLPMLSYDSVCPDRHDDVRDYTALLILFQPEPLEKLRA